MSELTLEQFQERLEKHDWYYAMSDDDRVYQRGRAEYAALTALAVQGGDEYMQAMADVAARVTKGG